MVLVVGGAILLGPTTTVVLFAILSFMALREFWTLTPSRRGDHYALFLSFFVVLPYHYYLLGTGWYGMFVIFIPVYAFLLLPGRRHADGRHQRVPGAQRQGAVGPDADGLFDQPRAGAR